MSKHDIAELVRRHSTGQQLGDIYFEVDVERIQTGDNWWRVPVRPSRLPCKLYTMYEFLAELEDEIASTENRNILLMTGEPLFEDDEAAPVASKTA
jgi:hypothetical protein